MQFFSRFVVPLHMVHLYKVPSNDIISSCDVTNTGKRLRAMVANLWHACRSGHTEPSLLAHEPSHPSIAPEAEQSREPRALDMRSGHCCAQSALLQRGAACYFSSMIGEALPPLTAHPYRSVVQLSEIGLGNRYLRIP